MPEWLQKIAEVAKSWLFLPPGDKKSVEEFRASISQGIASTAVALTGGGAENVAARILNPEETKEVVSALSSLGWWKDYEIPRIDSMLHYIRKESGDVSPDSAQAYAKAEIEKLQTQHSRSVKEALETLKKYHVPGGTTIIGHQVEGTQDIYYRARQFFDRKTAVIDWGKINAVPQNFSTELQEKFWAQINETVRVNDAIAAAKKKILDLFGDSLQENEALTALNQNLWYIMNNPNLVEEIEKKTEEVIAKQTAILERKIAHRRQLDEMQARMSPRVNSETNDGTQESAVHNRKQEPPPVFARPLEGIFGELKFNRSENDVYYARIAATQEDQETCTQALCSLLRLGGQKTNLPTQEDLFTAPLFNLGSPAKATLYIKLPSNLVRDLMNCESSARSLCHTDADSGFVNKEKITEALNTLKNLGKVQAAYSQVGR